MEATAITIGCVVETLCEAIKAWDFEPDSITYSTIIKGYHMSEEIDWAFSMLKKMEAIGFSSQTRSGDI